jgi:predicted peroxiredoxin
MEKIVNRLISDSVVGADRYTNNGSTWLIFTETKQWVIELTKEKTLWYNYNFFKNLFAYLDFDVVDNQNYITKWVEDNIINEVKDVFVGTYFFDRKSEDTLQNGVKETKYNQTFQEPKFMDTLKNGVKETNHVDVMKFFNNKMEDTLQDGVKYVGGIGNPKWVGKKVEETIKNGIKETIGLGPFEVTTKEIEKVVKETKTPGEDGDILGALDFMSDNNTTNLPQLIEDVIQNGIKETKGINGVHGMNETIQNGVKETKLGAPDNRDYFIEDAIQNGVKHTEPGGYLGSIEMKGKIVHQLESPKQNEGVEDVIQNGVKYTVCSSAPFFYSVKDTLQHGVKETFDETHHRRREVVRTIRDGIKETYHDGYQHKSRIDGVIKNGIKETCAQIPSIQPVVERILEEGILQTKPMDEWVNTNRIVDKVMAESIKETLWMNGGSTNWGFEGDNLLEERNKVDDTIKNGIKEVQPLPAQDGNRDWGNYYYRQEDITKPHTEYVKDVIENGIKETIL